MLWISAVKLLLLLSPAVACLLCVSPRAQPQAAAPGSGSLRSVVGYGMGASVSAKPLAARRVTQRKERVVVRREEGAAPRRLGRRGHGGALGLHHDRQQEEERVVWGQGLHLLGEKRRGARRRTSTQRYAQDSPYSGLGGKGGKNLWTDAADEQAEEEEEKEEEEGQTIPEVDERPRKESEGGGVEESIKAAMIAFLRLYKKEMSPLLPPACRFTPTCSEYAVESVQNYGPAKGVVLTAWRLLRCSPIGGAGFDPPTWPPPNVKAGTWGKGK